jgi:hypothetical protein
MATPPAALGGPTGGFAPADLATAYGFDRLAPTAMTVAIVDAYDDPNAKADLNFFNAHYGLPAETATSFRKVNQAGNAAPLPAADEGWATEITLDVQAVRAVCQNCRILLVEANSSGSFDLARAVNTAVRLGADVVSNSYGAVELKLSQEPAWVRAAYDHPGVVITASTGDDGWYSWDKANRVSPPENWSYNKPNTPSAYPTVVAVAGTNLTVDGAGHRLAETVWNDNGAHDSAGLSGGVFQGAKGASGGGCSTVFAAPAWQTAATGFGNTGCGSKRLAGDVAAIGDPTTGLDIYYTYPAPGGWFRYGGTSLSSPLIAAMWALAGGAGSERYPAKSLYDRLRYTPSALSDITVGSNSFCGGDSTATCSAAVTAQFSPKTSPNDLVNGNNNYPGHWAGLLDCSYAFNRTPATIAANTQCNATAGYDGPSGVGAPAGLTLFQPTQITAKIHAPAVLRLNVAQGWSATNVVDGIAGAVLAYKWTWGDGSPATLVSSTTHKFTQAGTHKVTLTVSDDAGQHASVSKTITVGVPPVAVITGPTTVHVGRAVSWTSKNSVAKSTGASIASRSWSIDGHQEGTSTALAGRFNHTGTYTLKLKVVDNTGLVGTKQISVHVIA